MDLLIDKKERMSPCLALYLLGHPQLELDHKPVAVERRKAMALLVYLVMQGGKHTREFLSGLLWPDYVQSKAFSNLRHTLWEIQGMIGEGWVIANRESLEFAPESDIDLDVTRFRSLLSQSRLQNDLALRIPLLVESAKLYRNHFLTGFSLKDAQPFNEWVFTESEELQRQLADGLTLLIDSYRTQNEAQQAIPYARRLIALDPLEESAHRLLMEVFLQAGQPSAALKQYQICEQILRKELNVDPQPETRQLFKSIRQGKIYPSRAEKQVESVTPQHNLPLQLSKFIGRATEQEEILQVLTENRLVTLVGTGGIGKTRLALEVGQKLLDRYPDGVWFVGLDSLSEPALVPQTVASVFDIREGSGRPVIERLIEFFHENTTLLILDNCEHLLKACVNLITILLKNCPGLKIMATSRETLNMPGEAVYYMPSLSVPEPEVGLEKLVEYESIRLFTERASLASNKFALTDENARTVIHLCRKVDGIPLAIELAAARVNILHVGEILKQLQESFALLASDSRNTLPRHQTLQASMGWSWGLLTGAEQMFMSQLSVFAGGWTLESAQAVCDGDVLGLTNALVKKSLIVVDQEAGPETRYRFHEIVRQYAHDKLNDLDAEKIRTRHLRYFLRLSDQAESAHWIVTQPAWMSRWYSERDNLRAALAWAEQTDVEAGLYLAGRLVRFWEILDLREGKDILSGFLQKPESTDFSHARATALHALGFLLTWLQQFVEALDVAQECLKLFHACEDKRGEADALVLLANIKQFLGEQESAMELCGQSLTISRSLGDLWRQATAFFYMGWDQRNFQNSYAYWEKGLALFRKTDDAISLANQLGVLGQFRVLNGEVEVGEKYLDEALALWEHHGKADIWETAKVGKSLISLMHGDYEQARSLLQETLQHTTRSGNHMGYLWVRTRLGHVALRAGNLVEAHQVLAETAQDFHKSDYLGGVGYALEGIAQLYSMVGKFDQAARLIGWADGVREEIGTLRPLIEQADVDRVISACLTKLGEVVFSDAYDEGRGMTPDEVVEYAVAGALSSNRD